MLGASGALCKTLDHVVLGKASFDNFSSNVYIFCLACSGLLLGDACIVVVNTCIVHSVSASNR